MFGKIISVSFFILLSRITGLLREVVVAGFLGASAKTDALFVAFSIPNIARRFLADGLISPAFVPTFVKAREKGEIKKAMASVLGFMLKISLLASFLVALSSPLLPYILSPGFTPEQKTDTTIYLLLFSPYILLMSLASTFTGLLNSLNIFTIPVVGMSLFNIFIIIGVFISPFYGFVFGVILSGIFQILIQLPQSRNFLGLIFSDNEYSQGVKKALLPIIGGGAIYYINFIVSRSIASFAGEGTISYLSYATRFLEFPLGVFVYPIANVFAPLLSKGEKVEKSFIMTFAVGFSATIIFSLFSYPIIQILFERKEFTPTATYETSKTLFWYSLGLIFIALGRILILDFQVKGDLKIPLIASLINFLSNLFFCIVLLPKRHEGIAIASSISYLISTLFLAVKHKERKFFPKYIFRGLLRSLLPSFISLIGFFLYSNHFTKLETFIFLLILSGIFGLSLLISLRR